MSGTWQRQGRSVQPDAQEKRSGAKLPTSAGGGNVLAVTVYLPHVRPLRSRQRLARRNSSEVGKMVFRLFATSRPPSSGLHL